MSDVRERLARSPTLEGQPGLVDDAARIFDFVQFLLDDDDHLTPTGNLNAAAKSKLRARIAELISEQVAGRGELSDLLDPRPVQVEVGP